MAHYVFGQGRHIVWAEDRIYGMEVHSHLMVGDHIPQMEGRTLLMEEDHIPLTEEDHILLAAELHTLLRVDHISLEGEHRTAQELEDRIPSKALRSCSGIDSVEVRIPPKVEVRTPLGVDRSALYLCPYLLPYLCPYSLLL